MKFLSCFSCLKSTEAEGAVHPSDYGRDDPIIRETFTRPVHMNGIEYIDAIEGFDNEFAQTYERIGSFNEASSYHTATPADGGKEEPSNGAKPLGVPLFMGVRGETITTLADVSQRFTAVPVNDTN